MLPSTKRPKEVEEEKAARAAAWAAQKAKEERVVLQGSKVESILDGITTWYSAMPDKEKRRLTPVAFKRKVVSICYQHEFDYDLLPIDWITTIKDRCGLKLYERIKKEPEAGSDGNKTQINKYVSVENERKRRRSSRDLSSTPSTSISSAVNHPEANDVKPKILKEPVKKFVDLSNEVPPPFWLQAYSKGIVLPRILTIYSTEDTNILYYDYNPKLKDCSGKEVKLAPQPRTDMRVIANLFTKPIDDDDDDYKCYRKRRKRSSKRDK